MSKEKTDKRDERDERRREGVEAADDTGMVRQQELLVEADLEDVPGGAGEADDQGARSRAPF